MDLNVQQRRRDVTFQMARLPRRLTKVIAALSDLSLAVQPSRITPSFLPDLMRPLDPILHAVSCMEFPLLTSSARNARFSSGRSSERRDADRRTRRCVRRHRRALNLRVRLDLAITQRERQERAVVDTVSLPCRSLSKTTDRFFPHGYNTNVSLTPFSLAKPLKILTSPTLSTQPPSPDSHLTSHILPPFISKPLKLRIPLNQIIQRPFRHDRRPREALAELVQRHPLAQPVAATWRSAVEDFPRVKGEAIVQAVTAVVELSSLAMQGLSFVCDV